MTVVRYDNDPKIQGLLVVNPSPRESRLQYLPPAERINSWRVEQDASGQRQEDSDPVGSMATASILQQRIWWWLLLIGLVALTMETTWLSLRKEPT